MRRRRHRATGCAACDPSCSSGSRRAHGGAERGAGCVTGGDEPAAWGRRQGDGGRGVARLGRRTGRPSGGVPRGRDRAAPSVARAVPCRLVAWTLPNGRKAPHCPGGHPHALPDPPLPAGMRQRSPPARRVLDGGPIHGVQRIAHLPLRPGGTGGRTSARHRSTGVRPGARWSGPFRGGADGPSPTGRWCALSRHPECGLLTLGTRPTTLGAAGGRNTRATLRAGPRQGVPPPP